LLQSSYLAWGFELSYCPVISSCQGTSGDAKLESIVREWPGTLYICSPYFLLSVSFLLFRKYQSILWDISQLPSDMLMVMLQLRIEQRRGRVFRGWSEGKIYFPPTYKYSTNSDRYAGDDMHPKEKRRTPAW
jgi:hypothetical protein